MKKFSWILALLAALTMVFIGCGGGNDPVEDTSGGVMTDVFTLSEFIADMLPGKIANFNETFASTPLRQNVGETGDSRYSIVRTDGQNFLVMDNMVAGWGESVDIYNAYAGFKPGDTLTVKAVAEVKGEGVAITSNDQNYLGPNYKSNSTDGIIDQTFTITAQDIANMKGRPYFNVTPGGGVRIHYVGSDGPNRIGKIVFEDIIIKGIRGGGAVCGCTDTTCKCGCVTDCGPMCPGCTPKGLVTNTTVKWVYPFEADLTDEIVGKFLETNKNATQAQIDAEITSKLPGKIKDKLDELADDGEFYINLNDIKTGANANYVTSKGSIKIQMTKSSRIDFSTLTGTTTDTALRTALTEPLSVAEKEPIKVEVNASALIDAKIDMGLTDGTAAGNWRGTNDASGKLSSFSNTKIVPVGNANNIGSKTYFTLILDKDETSVTNVEIKSIKLTIPKKAQSITITDLTIEVPVAGNKPQAAIADNGQFKGAITWNTSPVEFAGEVDYTATVALTPRSSYWAFDDGAISFTVNKQAAAISTWTGTAAAQSPTVTFTFPKTQIADNFAGTVKIQVQGSDGTWSDATSGSVTQTQVFNLKATYVPSASEELPAGTTIIWIRGTTEVATGATYEATVSGAYTVKLTKKNFMPETGTSTFTLVPQATVSSIPVKYGAADGTVTVTAGNSTGANPDASSSVAVYQTGSTPVTTGYFYLANGASYGRTHSRFEVTFPASGKLEDYKSVTFKYQGINGDVGWKDVKVHALKPADAIQGWASDGDWDAAEIGKVNYANDGKTEAEFTVDFSGTNYTALKDEGTLLIYIRLHAGAHVIRISDIVFNEAD